MRRCLMICLTLLLASGVCAAVPVGTVVIYSDGSVEKLLADAGGTQRWEDDRKRLLVRSANPIQPLLERTEFLSKRGYRQRLSNGQPDAIRRLPPGTPVAFSVLRTKHDGESARRHWECLQLDNRRERVIDAEYDLERYRCERFTIHRKLHNKTIKETREFSYSRDLGLIVDLQRTTPKKDRRKTLVKIFLPGETDYRTLSRATRRVRRAD